MTGGAPLRDFPRDLWLRPQSRIVVWQFGQRTSSPRYSSETWQIALHFGQLPRCPPLAGLFRRGSDDVSKLGIFAGVGGCVGTVIGLRQFRQLVLRPAQSSGAHAATPQEGWIVEMHDAASKQASEEERASALVLLERRLRGGADHGE